MSDLKEMTRKCRVGDSALTRDLVWCECGRGLSLSGRWAYCPNCGYPLDQDSYGLAVNQAILNGARLYRDTETVEVLAAIAHKLGIEKEELPGQLAAQIVEKIDATQTALVDAALSLYSYEQSYGAGGGADEAFDIARMLGFEDGFDETIPWLKQRRAALERK